MLKLSKLMGALILAGFLQDALDAQVVIRGGVAAAAARSGEFRTGEQVSARSGRGRLAATNNPGGHRDCAQKKH